MFDIGFGELVLCAVVALLVFGPEKLPGLLRDLGRVRRQVNAAWSKTRASLEKEIATIDATSKPRITSYNVCYTKLLRNYLGLYG